LWVIIGRLGRGGFFTLCSGDREHCIKKPDRDRVRKRRRKCRKELLDDRAFQYFRRREKGVPAPKKESRRWLTVDFLHDTKCR